MIERCSNGGERKLQVFEHLRGLRRKVSDSDDIASLIERDLAGNINGPAATDFDDVCIAGGR